MYGLVDRLLLLSCCFVVLLWQSNGVYAVLAVLLAITVSALNGYHRSLTILVVSVLGYSVVAFVWKEFAFFLPLVLYDLFVVGHRGPGKRLFVTMLVPLLVIAMKLPVSLFIVTGLIAAIGYVLAQRGVDLETSRREAKILRDDSWELTTLLKKQNRELIEKQDYGVRMARLQERSRIAREIHDHVGHLLSRCILQVGAVLVSVEDAATKQNLSSIKDTLSHAMDRIRASVHGLYEESLDLRTQVEGLVGEFSFCPIRLDYKLEQNPDKEVESCFVAIIKEGLNNIVRHSNATLVTLTLLEHPGLYQLVMQDNGTRGSEMAGRGLGLQSMTDRVESLGGRFRAEHAGGFRLFISIPKGRASHESAYH